MPLLLIAAAAIVYPFAVMGDQTATPAALVFAAVAWLVALFGVTSGVRLERRQRAHQQQRSQRR